MMKNSKDTKNWYNELDLSHPLVIAGPCSAETEEQVMSIAKSLRDSDTTFFRAGVWKPRTRPGCFEGIGEPALKWLKRVKEEVGLKVATEVANKEQIKLALEYDIDLLWIGARTTVNPFSVQEIADCLNGIKKPILVKNPVNPDLSLWLGAVERLQKTNIKNLGVIHRGFSTYEKTKYRNLPEWQLPIELQSRFPDLPIICDPSHISGRRDSIYDISQMALDLKYDGLMIETHNNPDSAWSDSNQQITPKTLIEITKKLRVRKENDGTKKYTQDLKNLRSQIDIIDETTLEMIAKRMKISNEIGLLKKKNNVAVLQNTRWEYILEKMVEVGNSKDLSEEFIKKIFKAIHQESINHQGKILKN